MFANFGLLQALLNNVV